MSAQATFFCQQCSEVAATLTLTPASQLIQDGYYGHITEGVAATLCAALKHALETADVRQLYHLDNFWAPFYCPDCDHVYCNKHWRFETQFDSDFPGWYDCTYGICPQGHRHMVDD